MDIHTGKKEVRGGAQEAPSRAREEGGMAFTVDDALVAAVGRALRDVDAFRPASNLISPEQVRTHLLRRLSAKIAS